MLPRLNATIFLPCLQTQGPHCDAFLALQSLANASSTSALASSVIRSPHFVRPRVSFYDDNMCARSAMSRSSCIYFTDMNTLVRAICPSRSIVVQKNVARALVSDIDVLLSSPAAVSASAFACLSRNESHARICFLSPLHPRL